MVNFRTLDLNLLRVFAALAQTRNTTRAAEDLGLTQPAVSAALSRLRDHLGDPLFVRAGNGMVATDLADTLAPKITAALEDLQQAIAVPQAFVPATADMTFTLRGADFFSMHLIPHLAATISRIAPGVSLRFLDSGFGDLVELLGNDGIDLALEQPTETPQWVSRSVLFTSPFKVVASRRNAAVIASGVAEGDAMPLDLFCSLPHALRSTDGSMAGMTDAALAGKGLKRRVTLTLPHFEALLVAAANSEMISVVPAQLAEISADAMGLLVFDPPIPIPVPKIQLYWHSRHDNAPAHRWLRARVLDESARLWGRDPSFD